MRVAFDHQIFAWQAFGGISRYACEIAARVGRYPDIESVVVAPLYMNRYLAKSRSVEVIGRHIAAIPHAGRLLAFLTAPAARRILRRLQPRVVHETYYSARATAPRSARAVVTVHDMIHEKFGPVSAVFDRTSRAKRLAVARADHIICVSESTRRDLVELFGVEPERTSVVHHGCSATPGDGAAPLARPYLLFVGARGGYKNFEGLLRAYAWSPALRSAFAILCFGGGALNRRELAVIDRLAIPRRDVIHATGDDDAMFAAYRHAQALVYPSLYEGFGMPTLEAMASRCPVVCSSTSSLPEVCENAAEYFDPADPAAIAAAVERALLSTHRRSELVAEGLRRLAQFSWEACAGRTAQVYHLLR